MNETFLVATYKAKAGEQCEQQFKHINALTQVVHLILKSSVWCVLAR